MSSIPEIVNIIYKIIPNKWNKNLSKTLVSIFPIGCIRFWIYFSLLLNTKFRYITSKMRNDKQTKFCIEYLKMKEKECREQGDKFGTDMYQLYRKIFFS
jgi:hypothetical protein